ncbi:MAG: CbiX/SirB N-terminal domain-containing protein [Chloroflexi bacterium]|nr:CbiX/SirB N-terminal domain-containing protein [Chloroflexota bacterium]
MTAKITPFSERRAVSSRPGSVETGPSLEGIAIVIAAHGVPARDYPPLRVGLLMLMHFAGAITERTWFLRRWRDQLENECRWWPRTPENDPYKMAVESLAAQLSARLGCPTVAAYNEFCAPTIGEAIEQVIASGAHTVVIVPTMLLQGNVHTEAEIYETILHARRRHPTIAIHYAWPFREELLVSLLASQVMTCLGNVFPAEVPQSETLQEFQFEGKPESL